MTARGRGAGCGEDATLYATDRLLVLPASSLALTVNVLPPGVAVSMFAPLATGPLQVARPAPASLQL
jgi:hypothetical protein